jgi:nucleoside-diphosphate-sugar epimerase
MTELRGKRVLVTGATGFIGGRLVERLVVEEGARVRALVRNFGNAARIGRFPVELVAGDLAAAESINAAVSGCDVVIHCGYGSTGEDAEKRDVTVNGTARVLDAALAHTCCRVVVVSTIAVYGDTPPGDLDETAPRRRSGVVYNDTKLEAEQLALSYCGKGLSVAVVQPTVVYGPCAGTWTVNTLAHLRTGRVILVDGGSGFCNAVYVDDVVTALLLAATSPRAHGEAFLISGAAPVTWRDFYARYEAMLGTTATLSMSAAEARAFYDQSVRSNGFARAAARVMRRELARYDSVIRARVGAMPGGRALINAAESLALLPGASGPVAPGELPIHPLPPQRISLAAARTRVKIDKAASLLGYRPAYDLERGMAVTEAWARWANLVPTPQAQAASRPRFPAVS